MSFLFCLIMSELNSHLQRLFNNAASSPTIVNTASPAASTSTNLDIMDLFFNPITTTTATTTTTDSTMTSIISSSSRPIQKKSFYQSSSLEPKNKIINKNNDNDNNNNKLQLINNDDKIINKLMTQQQQQSIINNKQQQSIFRNETKSNDLLTMFLSNDHQQQQQTINNKSMDYFTKKSEAIPINNNNNNTDMGDCLRTFLLNNEQQEKNLMDLESNDINININNNNNNNNNNNICSSFSSSSESSSESISSSNNQYLPPSTLLKDIVHETITFEHTEDFIRSLQIPLDVLDDLASRFILNMPQEEKYDTIRILFQMENAFWHYLDFCCEYNLQLPKFKFKRFAQIMFTYVPRLRQFLDKFDDIINKWIQYKFSIPCSGAIMLDETMDYILLVQGYGSKTWGFPKGKVNHDESLMNCAIREVFEETGYNCMTNILEGQYLERKIFESRLRLYLIRNVEFNYDFKPQARNEIRSIKWFALKDFPKNRQEQQQQQQKDNNSKSSSSSSMMVISTNNNNSNNNDNMMIMIPQNASKFVSVIPFISAIRKWVENEKLKIKFAKKRERRQQMKLAKKQERKAAKQKLNNDNNNEQRESFSNGSCSSISSIANDETIVVADGDDSDDQSLLNQSTTNFVDVDVNQIFGYREMYNCENDQRKNLLTREQRNNEQQTWQQQLFQLSNNNQNNNLLLPQAGHLEDIKRALIDNAFNNNNNFNLNDNNISSQSPSSSLILGSKGSCKEKLDILFGLASNQQQLSTTMISTTNNNQRPLSSMSVNLPNNNNNNNMDSIINQMIKPSMAPIGTKRSSSISVGRCDDSSFNNSGQTVISIDDNNNNKANNSIETLFNDLIINKSPTSSATTKTCHQTIQHQQQQPILNYNGLDNETIVNIHPKIEKLLKQLKTMA